MRAGSLRRQVMLQTRSPSEDTFGQQTQTWGGDTPVYADIEPLSGRELMAAQAVNTEITHQVVIRYRIGVTPAMRALYQGRVFNILSVIDDQMAHITLTLLCSEGLTTG